MRRQTPNCNLKWKKSRHGDRRGQKQQLSVRPSNARSHRGWHTSSLSQTARQAYVVGTIIPTSLMKKLSLRGVCHGGVQNLEPNCLGSYSY